MSGTATNIVFGLQATNTVKVGAYGAVEADAVDVGYTDGGVKMERSEEQFDIKVDQIVGAIESYTVDDELKITVALAEASVENLAIAFGLPTTAVSDGVLSFGGKTSNTNRTIYLNTKGITGGNRKTTLYKCKPEGNTSPAYMKGDKTMIDVTFKVLVDTSETAEGMRGTVSETGADSTAPTVAMTTPEDGATVAKEAKSTVLLTFTETNKLDPNSIVYGDTFSIINTTTPATAALVAGSIAFNSTAKTITFTPTDNWTAEDTCQLIVTTGIRDMNGNNLATPFIGQFSVAA